MPPAYAGNQPKPLFEREAQFEIQIEIVPDGTQTVTLNTDPALRNSVRSAITMPTIKLVNRYGRNYVEADYPLPSGGFGSGNLTLDCFFKVQLRSDGRTVDAGFYQVTSRLGGFGMAGRSTGGFDAESVDMIFVPDMKRARQTVDVVEIWGEQFVIEDVPVQHTEGEEEHGGKSLPLRIWEWLAG